MRTIGVAGTPISKDQWPLDAIEVKGTPALYSVARGHRPVNPFQIEAAMNFRNDNGRGFLVRGPRNRIGKMTILPRHFAVVRGIQRSGNSRKTKSVENSFDANPREIDPCAALRLRGQIDYGVDMPRSQLLAAASEFSKNAPRQPSSECHGGGRDRRVVVFRSPVLGNQQRQR